MIEKLSISVVVPALNAAGGLEKTVQGIIRSVNEVIVADGGSTDATQAVAERLGARVIQAEKGRGPQLRAGAAAASSAWLLFLHADTRLSPGWQDAARQFMEQPGNHIQAAAFRFRLDAQHPAARRLERIVAWRCRCFGLPYGDQGLLIHRAFYERLGGFNAIPLMEDVDMVRRIGRRNMVMLKADAITSAARYQRNGYWRRSARNLILLGLYWLGVPPRFLVRIYG